MYIRNHFSYGIGRHLYPDIGVLKYKPEIIEMLWSGPLPAENAQVFTCTCQTKASYSDSDYFFFYNASDAPFYLYNDTDGDDSDPAPGTGTGIRADISGATTAAEVATIVKTAIDADASFSATVSTDTVTVTNAATGYARFPVDVNSGDTLAVSTIGAGSEVSAANAIFDGTGTAAKVKVYSSSDLDASGSTGCTQVTIWGVNDSGIRTSEDVTMNGTTGVTTSTTWERIEFCKATAGTPAGKIEVKDTGGSITYLTINAAEYCSNGSRLYVPDGYHARLVAASGKTEAGYGQLSLVCQASASFIVRGSVSPEGASIPPLHMPRSCALLPVEANDGSADDGCLLIAFAVWGTTNDLQGGWQ